MLSTILTKERKEKKNILHYKIEREVQNSIDFGQ